MEETDEPCARLCGNCAYFAMLDDRPGGSCEWFGVCWLEINRDLGYERLTSTTIDWIYQKGRHGNDDCERPDEWFEE